MTNAIEIQNLCKQYPGFALNNISFCIPAGLCCGFVGPNGSGKTTTLKAMAGMIRKSSGEIRLLGKPADDVTLKESLGILFDPPCFQESWTPLDIEKSIRPFYRNWNSPQYRSIYSYLPRNVKICCF